MTGLACGEEARLTRLVCFSTEDPVMYSCMQNPLSQLRDHQSADAQAQELNNLNSRSDDRAVGGVARRRRHLHIVQSTCT